MRADEAALLSFKRELRAISRRLLSVREEEKRSLSASLHNSTGSLAVSLGSHLAAIRDHLANGRQEAALGILNETQAAVITEIRMMKRLAIDLRPPDLDEMSLAEALAAYFSDLSGRSRIPIDFRNKLAPAGRSAGRSNGRADRNPSEKMSVVLYRIAQEAAINAIRHAQARTIRVRLSQASDDIRLQIADDGRGFNPRRRPKKGDIHLGLSAMRELAASAGGTLRISSSPGKGTIVSATVPLRAKASP
jgi:two-component system NarL family sensor kinase